MFNYILLVAVVGASSCLTYVVRCYALRNSLMDVPVARSSHSIPTPRGGGMAIVGTFLLGVIHLWNLQFISNPFFFSILIFGSCVALVGFIDDHHFLTVKVRMSVHVFAVMGFLILVGDLPVVPCFSGGFDFGILGYFLYGVGAIWFLNLFNFMDGIDGLAAVETIFIAGSIGGLLWFSGGDMGLVFSLLLLAFASIGFLLWNWPPAKIFMGDGCSGFLGFVLAILAIVTSNTGLVNIWTWLILAGYFVIDATVTLFVRLYREEKICESHRSHAYQILSRRLKSHAKVTLGVLVLNMVWLLPFAVLSVIYPLYGFFFFLISLVPLGLVILKIGAGTTDD